MPRPNKGRSVRVEVRSNDLTREKHSYKILSTTNLLDPVAGTYVKKDELDALIHEGVKVVIVAPK